MSHDSTIKTQAEPNTTVVSFNSLTSNNSFIAGILISDKKVKRLSKYGNVTTDKSIDGVYVLLYRLDSINTYLHVSNDIVPYNVTDRGDNKFTDSVLNRLEKAIWDIITTIDEYEILIDEMKESIAYITNDAIQTNKSKSRFKITLAIAGILAAATAVAIYLDNK